MNNKPIVLIPHASGSNRDGDAARAIELAGGTPRIMHLNQLRENRQAFQDADMMLLPGGFSYGDALGAGRRWALDLELFFHDELCEFVGIGKRVLGICNGFQVLVKAGLLPLWNEPTGNRSVTLTFNQRGHFECRWVHLAVNPNCRADYLHDLEELIFCPVAHGEGNVQVRDSETLQRLEEQNLIAFRYVNRDGQRANGHYPLNPNGSIADIAGICSEGGNVLGLMPHPENHILPIQNPIGRNDQLGLALFKAMLKG